MNGIDIKKLRKAIDILEKDPDRAIFTFHAVNEWAGGTRSNTSIGGHTEGQTIIHHGRTFLVESDEPAELMGLDKAPSPLDSLIHALAACLSFTIVYQAVTQGIKLNKLVITVDGDIDIHGLLGLSEEVRPGFQDIRVTVDIDSDVPREKIEALVNSIPKVSPLIDSLRNRIPVEVVLK